MASTSEATIGAKVANAEQVLTHLKSFTAYAPADASLSAAALETLIAAIKTQNTEAASAIQGYSAAVDTRQKLFQKDPDSLVKIMSPLGATIRAVYGKASKEASDITAMVTKIRGVKVDKASKEPDAVSISQSERSYGSMTQNFSDIVTTLENYAGKYNPANPDITVDNLKKKLSQLSTANIAVTATYGKLKEKRDFRTDQYKQLTVLIQRIKDSIKSQYGLKSTEYSLVKGIRV